MALFDWTPIFRWYKIRFVVKCKEDACYDEICLCVQNINIELGSIVKARGRNHSVV